MKQLKDIHNCKQCQGKMIAIETDNLGNTYCGYCHKRVDYKEWYKNKDDIQKLLEEIEK